MSGAALFWIIVLDCWSMSSQLTTWTSRSMPVLALYAAANLFQNAAVLSFEYSAATILILLTGSPLPEPPAVLAPVPPLHAVSASAATAVAATNRLIMQLSSLGGLGLVCEAGIRTPPGQALFPPIDGRSPAPDVR